MQITQAQERKLKKILDLGKKGSPAILEYLFELEDKLEEEIPQIKDNISRLKGEKGDSYMLTEDDKKEIVSNIRSLIKDEVIIKQIFDLIEIDYTKIAKEATKYIEVPKTVPIDYSKIKKDVLADISIPVPVDGKDGKDADEEAMCEKIENDLIKDLPKYGDKFRDGLELLQEGDKLSIEAVEDLRKELDELKKAGGEHRVISSNRNLYQLLDVDVSGITTDQSIKWNGVKWVAYTPSPSPLTTKGDLYGFSTVDARIPVGDDGEVLTADSSNPLGVSWQPPQTGGVFTYYWTPTASDVASQYKQLDTPYATLSTFTTSAATDGQLLRTYVTEPNNPGLSFIPAGSYKTHIHANVATILGKKDTYLRAEIWEVDSAGVDIVKLADVGPTTILTAVSAEYIIEYSTVQVNLASTSSRIATKLYATVSGTGGQPDITVSVGDGTDSNTTFPAITVSVNNFVPYTGATKAVNLGSNSLSVQDEAYGASWNGSLQVPTKNAVYDFLSPKSGSVTRSGSYINTITKGTIVYTLTRTGNYVTGITDGTYTWTITRDSNNRITDWTVV